MAEPEPEPPEQGYRHLNITNRIGHSKVKVLRDGRITVFTSAKAERLTSHMQKKSRKQPEGGQTRTRAKKSDKNDYKAILGDFEGLPRINIAIHIVGSRGDVQPFIAIGHELSKPPYSHRVRICTHAVFKDFVEENGLEFFSIGGDPANLMAYMVKNPGLLPGMDSIKAGDVSKRRLEMAEIFEGAWRSCIEPGNGLPEDPNIVRTKAEESDRLFIADAIIANPPSYAHLHCAEKLSIPLHIIFTMPWSPTQMFPHPLANIAPSDVDSNIANYISYPMTELLAWQGLGDLINRFRVKTLNLDPISPLWGHVLLARLKVPFTYCWSQELIPKPKDWGPHINITGFSFLSLASSYKPPDDLAEFLAAGPPPVYIGFGSIVVQKPNELTTLIFNAVKRAGVRALVSKGWGGLGEDAAPEGVFMLGNCPHDWLFKHVSAVVHHGGAGTTAIGLALGKPTVIVPFFGDQPFWGAMVYKAGAGPEPVPFKKMTEESLAHSIQQALGPGIQIAAEKMGETIRNEKPGALEAARSFQTAINLDAMKCYLAPDKVAVWRIKKTNLQLSGLAVGLLIENKHVRVDEIKLMRHIDWYMDEGAEGPVVGAVAAVAETVTSLVNNIEDYFKALSKTFQKKPPEKEVSPQDSIELADTTKVETNGLQELPTNLDFQDVINNDDNFERHLDSLAWHMAAKTTTKRKKKSRGCLPASMQRKKKKKSFHSATGPRRSTNGPRPSTIGPRPSHDHDHGPALEVAHDTTVFAQSMVEAWLKAPVALFYNIANGLHNFPSYVFHDDTVRRRENITGLGSGAKVAAQGWGFGMFDAITGLVTQPYLGAKKQGVAGFGKGIGKGVGGLVFKTVAAQFGLIGYTLKGVEKQILKRRSRDLKARIIAVRLRQGLIEYERSTPEERQAILERWDKIKGLVRAV